MIPMVDLHRQYLDLKTEIDAAIQEVLTKTQFILGPNVAQLETEVAAYHGAPHAIGVANGTDALLIALKACGIGPGDEVITTPFTFIATAEVVALLGAAPVFADIESKTFNIDPGKIEEKITSRTKAIIPVHLFGHPAEMGRIMEIARKHKLKVIEDCAQAFGAEYKGAKVGTFGECGCFSFFPSKNLACCGDGGMVITRDNETAERIRMLRNHGSRKKYYHSLLGFNSRLDEIHAAVLRVKLKRIDQFNKSRRAAAGLYRKMIARRGITLPGEQGHCLHVYHQFTIRSRERDLLMKALQENNIGTAVYYPLPLHLQEVFAGNGASRLPGSEQASAEVLSLPMFPEIREEEVRLVSDVINNA